MKIVRWVAVAAFLVITANIALADGAGDPRFQTIGGGHSTVLTSPTDPAFQVNFTAGVTPLVQEGCGFFGGNEGGSCILVDFINNSKVTWSGITITITGFTGDITQGSFTGDNVADPYFASFAQTTNGLGQTVLSWSGIDGTHPGILPATSCDGNSCTGPYFPGGGDFPVPEFDFGILVDVSGALQSGDSFTSQGTATTVPEPNSIVLTLAGAALLGLYLSKRAA